MGEREVEAFLTHLAVKGKVSAFTQNQAKSALLFLYREVLEQALPWLDKVTQAKTPTRLPVVLTVAEVQAVLKRLSGTRWLIASLLYGAGLRRMEAVRILVKDVEFTRHGIIVREGKGAKYRVTMLPERRARVGLAVYFSVRQIFAGSTLRHDALAPRGRERHPACDETGGARCANRQTGDAAQFAPFLRHASVAERLRHPHRPGTARPLRREHHHDLHPRAQSRWARHSEQPFSRTQSSPFLGNQTVGQVNAVTKWCADKATNTNFIEPGSPWQNAYIESFNGRFRDEVLNLELFDSLLEARVVTKDWRTVYNTIRPHGSHRGLTPTGFALTCKDKEKETVTL